MILNLEIDNQSIPIKEFSLPEMSLSSARASMKQWGVSLTIQGQELVEILDSEYQQLVSDLKDDDEQVGSPQDELGKAGYPSLTEVLKDNELLESAIYCLFEDLVSKFSKLGPNTNYWHDEISSCKYEQGKVYINGICYSKK